MTKTHSTVRTMFVLVVAGIVVPSYLAAQTSIPTKPTPNKSISNKSQVGAQIVAQGTTRGAVACARCHGFDGASDARQNALMQPIAKGLKDDEIEAVAQYYASVHTVSFPSRPVPTQLRDLGKQVAEV